MEGIAHGIYWVCYNQWFRHTSAPVGWGQPQILETTATLTFCPQQLTETLQNSTYTLLNLTLHPNLKILAESQIQFIPNQYVQWAPPNLQLNAAQTKHICSTFDIIQDMYKNSAV